MEMGTERSDLSNQQMILPTMKWVNGFTFIYMKMKKKEKREKQKSKYLDCDMITCGAITMESNSNSRSMQFYLFPQLFSLSLYFHLSSDHWCYN